MKLVLRTDVSQVGKKGDIVEVADGYARNYLLPRSLAFPASANVVSQANAMRRSRDLKDQRDREAAETVARTLTPKVITIAVKSGAGGRLFGSVTANEIVEAVAQQTGIELDRRKLVHHDPIKTLGEHQVSVKLHSDVECFIRLDVVAR
jgi:large subunit ribosomal protein L9